MKKHIFTMVLLFSAAQAAELRIYPGFAEIIEAAQVKDHQVTLEFTPSDLCQIVPRSLDLLGGKVIRYQVSQKIQSGYDSLIGLTVGIRSGSELREGTLVKYEGNQVLIQDAKTGWYFRAPTAALEYQKPPPNVGISTTTQYQFEVQDAQNLQLRYLSRAINWQPRYTLDVAEGKGTIHGWAEITSNLSEPLKVDGVKLFGGNIKTTFVSGSLCGNSGQNYALEEADAFKAAADYDVEYRVTRPTTQVQNAQQVSGGIYQYDVNVQFELPKGKYALPVQTISIEQVKQVMVLRQGFRTESQQGYFQRQYHFDAPEFLFGGIFQIRDGQFFVGESSVPSAAKGSPVVVNMGEATEVTHQRRVTYLGKETIKQANSNGGYLDRYEVTLTFKNYSDRVVQLNYLEDLFEAGRKINIEKHSSALKSLKDQIQFLNALAPLEEKTLQFTFTKEHRY